ncbi:MAG: hypothetical protein A3H70_04635 [Candidatus Komeilibacteria bacterium RIFCSPLOWO2_02_FULL_48_11]|uniref:Uncharacterized protein n=1 Tax=Candidatus Komeilibacteria bacterium RIFCSPLOWO2_02_FULL_48_11 TaxID=1798553 RepID=A0A1G2BTS0_9BACT|nr:MAG: hypothetical protein A3H70_04635 [Candidatus Komeilibacteria bacterium RIFCSPLOWO2_02_FULL_48_11]
MKIARWVLYLMAIVFLGWIGWQNFSPAPIMVLRYKKGDPASPISDLYPHDRVIDLPENGSKQSFYREPIYFDVLVPPKIKQIAVDITWQNQLAPIVKLGARKRGVDWIYNWQTLQDKNKSENEQRKTLTWPRQDFFIDNNRVNFSLSVPDLEDKYGQIIVGDITATITREPFGWPELVIYAKNIIGLK